MWKRDFNFDKDSKGGVATERRMMSGSTVGLQWVYSGSTVGLQWVYSGSIMNKRQCELHGQI